jgi:hypothetical protein
MKRPILKNAEPLLYGFILIVAAWCSLTSAIMAFKHPEMTQTQVFLAIPKSFVLNFETSFR